MTLHKTHSDQVNVQEQVWRSSSKKFNTATKAEIDNLKPENKLINGTRALFPF